MISPLEKNLGLHKKKLLKLIRSEVEALVDEKHGSNYLKNKKIKKELAHINKELKMLKAQVFSLEQRKAELMACLDE